jgi:class 3 adenylate cyclase
MNGGIGRCHYCGVPVPETRYASLGDAAIAYQVIGLDGPDIVFLPDWYNHVEAQWEDPFFERFLHGLSSIGRLIVFDKRGTGLSDPVLFSQAPPVEEWADDLAAVMDAAESEAAILVCASVGSFLGLPFAAMRPQRVAGLVLIDATASAPRRDDYPEGVPEYALDRSMSWFQDVWGSGRTAEMVVPSRAGDSAFIDWRGRYERLSASPGTIKRTLPTVYHGDVRSALGSISCPTLVIHRRGDKWVRPMHGRYLAEHITHATYAELPGDDHLWFGTDVDEVLAEIVEFVTGHRSPIEPDRVLTTIMFSDIVASTEQLATMGDWRWRNLLERHDQVVQRQLNRFRGRQIKHTGDGILASFDGPARAVRCGSAIIESVRGIGLHARVGIHTGECELHKDDLVGMAVNIAARIGAIADDGKVFVSGTLRDLVVGSDIEFVDRGDHHLKGVPGTWRLYAVAG